MNIKKEVVENLKKMFQEELNSCNQKIKLNKHQFKTLAEQQTVLKRERVRLTQMLNDLK